MDSEKEMLLQSWNREYLTTLKVLKAYPQDRQDYKPHEKARSAKELAWVFHGEEATFVPGVITGKIDFTKYPKTPATFKETISEYEKTHKNFMEQIRDTSDEELNKKMKFMAGPKTFIELRKIDILWMSIQDLIHHRGQFSVYLRIVGGKVPSIYGPSADEPWM